MSYDKNMKYPPVLRVKFCELHVVVYKYKCIFKHKIRFFRKQTYHPYGYFFLTAVS